jgi:hypothetical protein
MYHAMLRDRLDKARKLVARDERAVAQQQEFVIELARDGYKTQDAQRLLGLFEDLRVMHIGDQRWLEKELAQHSD